MKQTPAFELSSSQLHNFRIDLESHGKVNLADFKKKLVTALKTSITGAEFDAGKKQQPITCVLVFVTFDSKGKPTHATFRKTFTKGTPVQYIARDINGETHLDGNPTLTPAIEAAIFDLLLAEVTRASPFDDLENGKNIHNAVAELAPELKLKKKK